MKYQVNPKFSHKKDVVINVRRYFEQSNMLLQDARNKIKKVSFEGEDYAIKSFKEPCGLNCLLYSFFRISKAKRSYDYSLKIAEFVPQAIGFVENYQGRWLTKSYFISELFDYDFTIREVLLDKAMLNRETIFRAFASFSYRLHEQGILHKDFSPGNILIKKDQDNYQFKIIDINRMHFGELSIKQRMSNFSMLWASDADLDLVVTHYAGFANYDTQHCQKIARRFNLRNKRFKNFKKRLKGKPVTD